MPEKDDWRRMGQEKYLKGINLTWKKYTKYRDDWDHDHCTFCSAKFMESEAPDILKEGYASDDNYYWVCKECYEDFKDEFAWSENNAV